MCRKLFLVSTEQGTGLLGERLICIPFFPESIACPRRLSTPVGETLPPQYQDTDTVFLDMLLTLLMSISIASQRWTKLLQP